MTTSFHFDPVELPPEAKELRQEVRAFLRQETEAGNLDGASRKGGFSRDSAARSAPRAGSA